jgi:transcriptional regulator with XRE-family HTH domain
VFYDNYLRLCNQKGVSASGAALEMGLSRAAVTGWAQGKVPRDATLRRIADYFGVSVEELTRDQKEKPAEDDEPQTLEEAREVLRQSGIRVLLDAEGDDFTPEEIKEIMNFIKFKHEQRGKQN